MRFPTLNKWDRVEIRWLDSYRQHGWVPILETDAYLETDHSLDHRTIGYFIGQTKRQVSVVQSSKTDKELIYHPETQVDAIMNIPKVCITKIKKL